jgi:hypothetical protein
MAFVIRFATRTVEIWLTQQSPLKWGPLTHAQRYRTEAHAHRAVANLWLRGVTIQDLSHVGRVIRLPTTKLRPRGSCYDEEAAGRVLAPSQKERRDELDRSASG